MSIIIKDRHAPAYSEHYPEDAAQHQQLGRLYRKAQPPTLPGQAKADYKHQSRRQPSPHRQRHPTHQPIGQPVLNQQANRQAHHHLLAWLQAEGSACQPNSTQSP